MMNELTFIESGSIRVVVDIPGPCWTDGVNHAVAYRVDETDGMDIKVVPLKPGTLLQDIDLGQLLHDTRYATSVNFTDMWLDMYDIHPILTCYPKPEMLIRMRQIACFLDEEYESCIPDISEIKDLYLMTDKTVTGAESDDRVHEGGEWDNPDERYGPDEWVECN